MHVMHVVISRFHYLCSLFKIEHVPFAIGFKNVLVNILQRETLQDGTVKFDHMDIYTVYYVNCNIMYHNI